MNPANDSTPQPAANPIDPMQAAGQQMPQNQAPTQPSVQSPEQLPAAAEQAIPAANPAAIPVPPIAGSGATQTQNSAQAPAANDVAPTTKNVAAKIIEDKDLIEKEYVDRARKIVEDNRDDPYKQSEELTAFRAEYMQKEYNKSIKIDK